MMFRQLLNPSRGILFLLLIHAVLLFVIADRKSATYDEPAHMTAAVSYYTAGTFDLYRVNPPLVRLTAGAGLMAAGVRPTGIRDTVPPGVRVEFFADQFFVDANRSRFRRLLTVARAGCIPFSLLGLLVVWLWTGRLYGPFAGMLAAVLWCFSPMILGHGSLTTCDVPAAGVGITAAWRFWCWLEQPNRFNVVLAGVALGLALLTKTILMVLPIVWGGAVLLHVVSMSHSRPWKRHFGSFAGLLSIGCLVLNTGYGFENTLRPLGEFRFVSRLLGNPGSGDRQTTGNRFTGTIVERLPVPLPANFVQGIDEQRRSFEKASGGYLGGHHRDEGWWYYYFHAACVKLPCAVLVLCVLAACVGRAADGFTRRAEWLMFGHILLLLGLASSQTQMSSHFRYVLPAFPFIYILIGRVPAALSRVSRRSVQRGGQLAVAGLGIWAAASSLYVFPHSLSYFNELVGGPEYGYQHLLGSNVDWGQELGEVERWCRDHPEAQPISLVYHGKVAPDIYGIRWSPAGFLRHHDQLPSPGWYAVSVNYLFGSAPVRCYDKSGTIPARPGRSAAILRRLTPVARAGYGMWIFHITDDDLASTRLD